MANNRFLTAKLFRKREWQGGKEIPILFFKWILTVRIFLSIHSPSSSLGLVLEGPSVSCSHIAREWRPSGNFLEQVVSAFSKGRLCRCWGVQRCWSCIAANLRGRSYLLQPCVVSHPSLCGYKLRRTTYKSVCLGNLNFTFLEYQLNVKKWCQLAKVKGLK